MTDTLIKVDLTKSPTDNENIHNRWHPDIPMTCWVNPGDDFILETFDWTGGFIKNNNSADDVRDIDLTTVHYLSGPVGVKGAEPGDLLVVDLLTSVPSKTACGASTASSARTTAVASLSTTSRRRRSRSGTSKACSPARATSPALISRD